MDFSTILAAGKTLSDLKTIIEKVGKNKPDALSALSLISRFQEQIDGLRAEVVELQTENLELKRKDDEIKEWKVRITDVELVTTPGGATVYARHGKPPYFCTVCYEKHQLIPLQLRRVAANCHGCKSIFDHIQVIEPEIPVLQRRPSRGTVSF